MPKTSQVPSRPPFSKSPQGSTSSQEPAVVNTNTNIIVHALKKPRRVSNAASRPKDPVNKFGKYELNQITTKSKNARNSEEKESNLQNVKTSITPFSYNEHETKVTKGYQVTSVCAPIPSEVQQLASSSSSLKTNQESLNSSYAAKLKHSTFSDNTLIVPSLNFHKANNTNFIHSDSLEPGSKSSLRNMMERSRAAVVQLWHRRSNMSQFLSTNFDNTRSRLTADALAMATIQLKMPRKDIWRSLIAELIGTCLLIIMGCGSILKLSDPKPLDLTGIGLCWGLTVATLAQTLGHVSGCHLNPAVTLAMMITGKLQLIKALLYIIAQCIGAMMGAAVLKALTPEEIQGNWGITTLGAGVTPLQGFGIEFVATFVLLMVIFGATDENRSDLKGSAPLAIGLCITALVLFCGPFTGASMNPARSLGPSVVASNFDDHWVYWLGPISGAITAAILYTQIFRAFSPEEVATIQAEEDIKKRDGDTKESAIPNV